MNKKVLAVGALMNFLILSGNAQSLPTDSLPALREKKIEIVKEVKKLKEEKKVEFVQMLQLWDVATLTNAGTDGSETRNDIYIRRGRTGIKGKIRSDLSYTFVLAYDGIGRDKNTAGNGNPNANDNREVYLWDGFVSWNYKPMLNITAGYFRPQVGRENITAAFKVISFEKSLANFQPRTHMVNRNTGRETGVNIGGLHLGKGWSFNYNVGAFDLTSDKLIGTGKIWSPLLAYRAAFTIGDAEMDSYKINYSQSYYGQRKGVTLAVNGSYTGKTEIFQQNSFYGADILANYGKWDFNAEYDLMSRSTFINSARDQKSTMDKVYSVRLGYNILLKNEKIIQLTGMYSGQLANNYGADINVNSLTKASDQEVYDVGVNYLLDKDNLKLNLHYVWGKKKQYVTDPKFSYVGLGMQWVL